MALVITKLSPAYHEWAAGVLENYWGEPRIFSRGQIYNALELPGLVALRDEKPSGLLSYHIASQACEIVALGSMNEGQGVGTALIGAVKEVAIENGCRRIWLVTTNDNLKALGFYQKRGFELIALHIGAIAQARKRKPGIPLIADSGIPIQHELELEMRIQPNPPAKG